MTSKSPEIVVVLAAGLGKRLKSEDDLPKPLTPLGGRPLAARVIDRFFEAGVKEAVVVLGHRAEEVRRGIAAARVKPSLSFAVNNRYELSNGLSVLAAKQAVGNRPFFLSMSDHIFDASLIHGLARASLPQGGLVLAVDRKLDDIYDMDDATKVRTESGRISAIGKSLEEFDAVDCGLFLASSALFDAILEKSKERADGDCSLSDGVQVLASRGLAHVHDIGEGRWQDVDTPETLAHARKIFV